MRDFLCRRGVFVKKVVEIPISKVLDELVEGDTEWPDNDIENRMRVKDLRQAPNNADTTTHQRKMQKSQNSTSKASKIKPPYVREMEKEISVDTGRAYDLGVWWTLEIIRRSAQNTSQTCQRPNIPTLFATASLSIDNFDHKLCLFNKGYDKAGVDDGEKHEAFFILFTGRTWDYNSDHLHRKKPTFVNFAALLKRQFIIAEHEKTLVHKYDNLTKILKVFSRITCQRHARSPVSLTGSQP